MTWNIIDTKYCVLFIFIFHFSVESAVDDWCSFEQLPYFNRNNSTGCKLEGVNQFIKKDVHTTYTAEQSRIFTVKNYFGVHCRCWDTSRWDNITTQNTPDGCTKEYRMNDIYVNNILHDVSSSKCYICDRTGWKEYMSLILVAVIIHICVQILFFVCMVVCCFSSCLPCQNVKDTHSKLFITESKFVRTGRRGLCAISFTIYTCYCTKKPDTNKKEGGGPQSLYQQTHTNDAGGCMCMFIVGLLLDLSGVLVSVFLMIMYNIDPMPIGKGCGKTFVVLYNILAPCIPYLSLGSIIYAISWICAPLAYDYTTDACAKMVKNGEEVPLQGSG
jgi:hypothetical protein